MIATAPEKFVNAMAPAPLSKKAVYVYNSA